MSNKKLIYKWSFKDTDKLNDIIPNQNVTINKQTNYLKVCIKQNRSTPGITINKKFISESNKVYLLEVDGYSSRKNSAFLFAQEYDILSKSKSKRLIENYTFISSDPFNPTTCAGWCCNYYSDVTIGILVTNPKSNDAFYIKEINLYEQDNIDTNSNFNSDCHSNHSSTYSNDNSNNLLNNNSNTIENTPNTDSNNISKNIVPSDIYKLNLPNDIDSCVFEKSENYKYKKNQLTKEEEIINACCDDSILDCSIEQKNCIKSNKFINNNIQNYRGHKDYIANYKLFNLFNLPKCFHEEYKLKEFVNSSIANYDTINNRNNNLSAGWSFFAQFISNDLTYNSKDKHPYFDLYSIYGNDEINYLFSNDKFILGSNDTDLFRNINGDPIIPDSRNDDNYIIAQLHVLFLLFHNKLIDYYSSRTDLNIPNLFSYVKKQVIYYYQWIIVNDFLSRLIDNDILNSICAYKTRYYSTNDHDGAIPVEFAIACFRYGHFTLNNYYNIAHNYDISLGDLHKFTKGNLPEFCIDWTKFFNIYDDSKPQCSKKIDTEIARDLNDLKQPPHGCYSKPKDMNHEFNSLYLRTLLRSQQYNLPSGQNVARLMGISPISIDTLKQFDTNDSLQKNSMLDNTPLIIYILKEAEIFKKGEMLTGCGGIIVAEVLLSILINDPNSYFNSNDKWTPSLPSRENNDFTIGDLITFIYS